jgi:hypothetical protein
MLGLELCDGVRARTPVVRSGCSLAKCCCWRSADDRETLRRLMSRLGVRASAPKVVAAWAVEKVGRLKPNGLLRGYSPLSRLVELDGFAAGIEGKRALWVALARTTGWDGVAGFDFDQLCDARRVAAARVEQYRLAAAADALR